MLLRLFLLFTLIPLVELYLLIRMGRLVGPWPTLGLVIFTGALGAWLARSQGTATWRAIQEKMARGELPAAALVDGLLILIAGAVLLTPGLLTDLAGFYLLVPAGRATLRRALRRRFETALKQGRGRVIVVEDVRVAEPSTDGPDPSAPRFPRVDSDDGS